MSRWVQHISGRGEKWKVYKTYEMDDEWCVYSKDRLKRHYLPKSEYRECPLPHRRMTGECYTAHGSDWLCLPGRVERSAFAGTIWKLVRKEDLADGEVAIVIEEVE